MVLALVLLGIFIFAGINGKQKVDGRLQIINAAKTEMENGDNTLIKLLDSIENGFQVTSVPYWRTPDQPMAAGNNYPRVAAMEPNPLTFTAVGQSDLYTHYVKPTVSGDDFALNFTELASPVQLLFGSFDLAFVIVFLLPLIIIAFSYNVLSSEKENGSIKLLASEPVSVYKWLMQKLLLRFFWLSVLLVFSILVVFLLNGVAITENLSKIIIFFILILAYALFWFAMAFVVNLSAGSSAKNAITLLGLWVLLVLVTPAVVNQLANSLYPMPSRAAMINEMRVMKADAAKKQDAILDAYLRDHPEYAQQDTTKYTFWHRYMASQKLIKDELAPVLSSYESQITKQQQLVKNFRFASPAIIVQENLSKIAGTSTENYESFRKQVNNFAGEWRSFFVPMLYKNEVFTKEKVSYLPVFKYQASLNTFYMPDVIYLILISTLLGLIGWLSYKKMIVSGSAILIQ